VGSGVFSASGGSMTLGSGSIAGSRTISVASSDTNATLSIESKGSSPVIINPSGNAPLVIGGTSGTSYGGIGGHIILGTTSDASSFHRRITTMGSGSGETLDILARGATSSLLLRAGANV